MPETQNPKPTFHCNSKQLKFGPSFGVVTFTNKLVSKKSGVPNTNATQPNVSANQPNKGPNVSRWNIVHVGYVLIGHVDFMLFVYISFVLGDQREGDFWCNMGFKVTQHAA